MPSPLFPQIGRWQSEQHQSDLDPSLSNSAEIDKPQPLRGRGCSTAEGGRKIPRASWPSVHRGDQCPRRKDQARPTTEKFHGMMEHRAPHNRQSPATGPKTVVVRASDSYSRRPEPGKPLSSDRVERCRGNEGPGSAQTVWAGERDPREGRKSTRFERGDSAQPRRGAGSGDRRWC
jgi:hypothetical protein